MIPASTSPAPAVASQGGALAAMVARPSGDATTVSGPFEFRAAWMLVADIAEQPRKFALMRGENNLRIVRCLDRLEQMIGSFGKTRQRIRVQHQVSLRRERGEDKIAGAIANTGARSDHASVEAPVAQQFGKLDGRVDGANHHRGQG
jgi:hypothetical protein